MAPQVHLSRPHDGVALLLLDDPPQNFGSYALLALVADRLREAAAHGDRVVVLASDVPGYFMAHASLTDVIDAYADPGSTIGDPRVWRHVTDALERGPMVSIACNHAQAWGGGAEISWACNLRTAGRSAHYAQIESMIGAIPGAGGTVRLSRLAGQSKAMEIILGGVPVAAEELAGLGIVNRLFEDADLRSGTLEWAAEIASRPARALSACKRGILQTWDLGYEDAIRLEGYLFNATMSADTVERIAAIQARYDVGAESPEAFGLEQLLSGQSREAL
ncbi:MAG TPA: enoyl-CoA hydratase/isomerase family protein [Solirubrobacteraceae bacterium]|nr:enoyl-CoA hydratase/isomerase family protein [Solirubrobacteraceae bacterium]